MSRLTARFANSHQILRRPCRRLVFAATIALLTLPGCMSLRGMGGFAARDPMAGAPRLRNHENPAKEELVAHLNRNTEKLECWRANSVKIHTNAIMLSGTLAVERGRRVRLLVSSPLGNEVDLGSNDERFWLWSKRMEPEFVTCRHENLDAARQALGVPFEPEWLMEALGVAPIPSSGVTMELDPARTQARLVQHITSAHGKPLRRVMVVDMKKGHCVVVEHSLYDNFAQPLAIAKLSGHRPDKETGIVMPHRVSLDWPQQRMQMTMDLGKVQVNPTSIPSEIFQMPHMANCEVVNLDEHFRNDRTATAAFVKLGSIEDAEEDSESEVADSDQDEFAPGTASTVGHSRISSEEEDEEEFEEPIRRQYVAPVDAVPTNDDWSE